MPKIISFYNNIKILSQFLFKISSLHWSIYLFLSLFWIIIINTLYYIDQGALYITTNDLFQISWSLIFYILFVISLIKTRAKTSRTIWKDKSIWKKTATFTGVIFGAFTIFLITTVTMNTTVYKEYRDEFGTSLNNLQKINNCSGDNFDVYYSIYHTDNKARTIFQYYKIYPKNIPIWITKYKAKSFFTFTRDEKILNENKLHFCPLN